MMPERLLPCGGFEELKSFQPRKNQSARRMIVSLPRQP